MINYIKSDYKTSILFNANEINGSECLMTLFYEMDYRLNKFIIQYYSNFHMGSRININNQLHIPIGSQEKQIKISVCSTLSLINVYIDRRLVYQEERSRSTKVLLLIGRPFFGKSLKTFNQFYHECPIVDSAAVNTTRFRLQLCQLCADLIQRALHLLGIGVPERM